MYTKFTKFVEVQGNSYKTKLSIDHDKDHLSDLYKVTVDIYDNNSDLVFSELYAVNLTGLKLDTILDKALHEFESFHFGKLAEKLWDYEYQGNNELINFFIQLDERIANLENKSSAKELVRLIDEQLKNKEIKLR